jgi:hypothetical protein
MKNKKKWEKFQPKYLIKAKAYRELKKKSFIINRLNENLPEKDKFVDNKVNHEEDDDYSCNDQNETIETEKLVAQLEKINKKNSHIPSKTISRNKRSRESDDESDNNEYDDWQKDYMG